MWRNLWEFFFSNHCSSRREVICLRMPLRSFLKALNSWVASPLDFLESSWQPGVHSTSFVTVSRTLCWNWLDKYILNYPKFQLNWKKKKHFTEHCTLWSKTQNITSFNEIWNLLLWLSLSWLLLMTHHIFTRLLFIRLSAGHSCMSCLYQVQWQKHFHCLFLNKLMQRQ